jgi:hypothetical protein
MRVTTPILASRSNLLWALFAAGMGLFIVAGASGLFGIDMHPQDGAPRWLGVCAGAVFVAGGLAIMVQSLAAAKPGADGGLSSSSPAWAQWISLLLALLIVGGLAAVGLWIAFGPGERHFTASVGIFSSNQGNEVFGRVVFGFGAIITCLVFVVFLVDGVQRLWRSTGT